MDEMIMSPVKVLGINVHPYTMTDTIELLTQRTLKKQRTFIITANAEIIMIGQKDEEYKNILNSADLVLADGAGTVWGGRKLGFSIPERVAGCDLFYNLMAVSAQQDLKVFFFGAAPGVAEEAKLKCEEIYPGCKIVGVRNGYFTEAETSEIISEINKSNADMLFVALGAPKQEKFLAHYLKELKPSLLMGIGGSFDVLTGKMERAPKWMQDASLEWLFRLYKQPTRFKRMAVLPEFVINILRTKR